MPKLTAPRIVLLLLTLLGIPTGYYNYLAKGATSAVLTQDCKTTYENELREAGRNPELFVQRADEAKKKFARCSNAGTVERSAELVRDQVAKEK